MNLITIGNHQYVRSPDGDWVYFGSGRPALPSAPICRLAESAGLDGHDLMCSALDTLPTPDAERIEKFCVRAILEARRIAEDIAARLAASQAAPRPDSTFICANEDMAPMIYTRAVDVDWTK